MKASTTSSSGYLFSIDNSEHLAGVQKERISISEPIRRAWWQTAGYLLLYFFDRRFVGVFGKP